MRKKKTNKTNQKPKTKTKLKARNPDVSGWSGCAVCVSDCTKSREHVIKGNSEHHKIYRSNTDTFNSKPFAFINK